MDKSDILSLQQFGGMLPAWDSHLLPQGQAESSLNGYLFSGRLEGWRKPKKLRSLHLSTAKMVYRLPTITSAVASAILKFISQPNEGDTFVLGEETYKFTGTVTNAYDIKIGADIATTAANTYKAVTCDDNTSVNEGTLYGTGTIANPDIDQTSPVTKNSVGTDSLTVVAPASGAAYNLTKVSESTDGSRLGWYTPAGVSTTTFSGGLNSSFNPTITSSATWMEFQDRFTDVVRSPVVDDSFGRYYWASPSEPPQYNTLDRINNGDSPWLLGVPAPGCAPTISVEGGGDDGVIGFTTSTSLSTPVPGSNIIYLIPVMPTGAVVLNDIRFVTQSNSGTAQFQGVLYDDLEGSPNNLLNTGEIITGCATGGTVISGFTNPSGLLMNNRYWIGFATDSAIAIQQANDTGSSGAVSVNAFSSGPPFNLENLASGFAELEVWGTTTVSGVLEARSYVYTYVTEYDEESPPSPATVVAGWSNGTWYVDLFTPPPDQMGVTRNITKTRIYRSITASSGATTYFFVAEVDVNTAQYVDTITDDTVALNNQLASQQYFPPPENLQGMVVMPNGIVVGWVDNEIWFCEPYLPHAWPPGYVITTEFPIVGLGVSGTSVIAATSGTPYVASGVSPSSMTLTKCASPEPCHSRGSVIGNSDGVFYCSPNGLIFVTPSGSQSNITEAWITRERWQQLTPQKNVKAVFLVSAYFAYGTTGDDGDDSVAQQGFTVELNAVDANSFTVWPQPGGHRMGFQQLNSHTGYNIDNILLDPWSAVCMVVNNGEVDYYDFSDPAPVLVPYKWRSKLFQQNAKNNFSAFRIFFDTPAGTPAQSATRNESDTDDPSWDTLAAGQYGIIRIFADGVLQTVREIRVNHELLRVLSGFKGTTWQFEIEAIVPISNVKFATSVKALAAIPGPSTG